MDFFSFFKCICHLARWSKYLYYIKKFLCIAAVALTGVFLLGFFCDKEKIGKLMKGRG